MSGVWWSERLRPPDEALAFAALGVPCGVVWWVVDWVCFTQGWAPFGRPGLGDGFASPGWDVMGFLHALVFLPWYLAWSVAGGGFHLGGSLIGLGALFGVVLGALAGAAIGLRWGGRLAVCLVFVGLVGGVIAWSRG